jgi:hypothetical protein
MKAKFVYEAVADIFVPKEREEVDKSFLEQNNMTYDEIMDFVMRYFEVHLKEDWEKRPSMAKGLQELVDGVKSGEYKMEFSHSGFSIKDEDDKTIRAHAIKNFDKIYKIGDQIGIKVENAGRPGIITDIRNTARGYLGRFIGKNGFYDDVFLEEIDLPEWEGVVGHSLLNLLDLREGDPIIPIESLV